MCIVICNTTQKENNFIRKVRSKAYTCNYVTEHISTRQEFINSCARL